MKSVLRIYIKSEAIVGLIELISEAATTMASQHEETRKRVRKLLREHAVLGRFSDKELMMGNLTYRCPVWLEIEDVAFDILEQEGLMLDRRIANDQSLISHYSVRHYFSVPTGQVVKLGRDGVDATLLISGKNSGEESRVAWVVSYDPTRDDPFRYRIDIEGYDLDDLTWVAIKIVACEKFTTTVSG